MEFIDISWHDYKTEVASHIEAGKKFIYRGQSNSDWILKTKLHRTGLAQVAKDIVFYIENIVPIAYQAVVAWEGNKWDLSNPYGLAQFIAYLQHNDFPTPLLDWTHSPYIAALFAFEGIDHFSPQYEHVCIYCFDTEAWLKTYKQSYDYKDENMHVSILEPSFVGNPKQMLQQGIFMYTNLIDIENHITFNQAGAEPFLRKYRLSSKERPSVMRELCLMNINSMLLFPSVESVCKKVFTDVSLLLPMGKTKADVEAHKFKNALLEILKAEEINKNNNT